MKVKDCMTRHVVAARRQATCRELAQQMLAGRFSGIPIVDDQLRVIGMVTEFDLLKALKTDQSHMFGAIIAEEIMSQEPICIEEEAELDEAIQLMTRHHIIRLPVVRKNRLVGVISRSDILRAFVQDSFLLVQDGQIVHEDKNHHDGKALP